MTHEYAGKYSTKHPAGTPPDPAVSTILEDRASDGRVDCATAHDIAGDLGVAPSVVGMTIDLLEYRIVCCQLGLFGYSPEKRLVTPADAVPAEMETLLRRFAVDGRIGCASCWKIAQELGTERLDVSRACERLGMKVKNCQLGAF